MIDLKTQVAELALNLKENTHAEWGIMNASHMIEHLAMAVKISNGTLPLKQAVVWDTLTDQQKSDRRKRLLSDTLFERNVKNPTLPTSEPPKLRKASFEESLEWFLNEINTFNTFWEANEDATFFHPSFGPLNKSDWEQFQKKHIYHHFKQFSLVN